MAVLVKPSKGNHFLCSNYIASWGTRHNGTLEETSIELVVMVLWGIWRARNEKLWNRIFQNANHVVEDARKVLSEWKAVRSIEGPCVGRNSLARDNFTWEKPEAPALKCNMDASIHKDSRKVGVGMVLRDATGSFISAKTNWYAGLMEVREAEAIAFKEALSWIEEMGIQDVTFESDSKVVIDAVRGQREDESEFGIIIEECRRVLCNKPSFRFGFTRRQQTMLLTILLGNLVLSLVP
ncbi:uncharacterized protein [Henckelia pumila]|uniref:uncharacterized protein n=1 Tax=Henckelia pumila TaxID=405737 RepID=UPI003C6E33DD